METSESETLDDKNVIKILEFQFKSAINGYNEAIPKLIVLNNNMQALALADKLDSIFISIHRQLSEIYSLVVDYVQVLVENKSSAIDALSSKGVFKGFFKKDIYKTYGYYQYRGAVPPDDLSKLQAYFKAKEVLGSLFNESFIVKVSPVEDFIFAEIQLYIHVLDGIIENGWGLDSESEKNYPDRQSRYITKDVRIEVWRRDQGRCVECGSQEMLEFDHIIPVTKGGSNTARNVQLLCEACNRIKSNKIAG